jgi:hypothetical protein
VNLTRALARLANRSPQRVHRFFCLVVVLLVACGGSGPRHGVLTPDGSDRFTLMSFAEPFDLDAPPLGWYHRTFRRHPPMEATFVSHEGRAAIRLATHDSASMLFRHVDVPLDDYPLLAWEWMVERGIEVDHDEMTAGGDDHPARLYLDFVSADGKSHAMEIIWGNRKLRAGEWKHLKFFGLFSFPHYVASGVGDPLGRWQARRVDMTELYRELWGDPTGARLQEIALFCDTDQTGAQSVAYFADVRVERMENPD